jgi:SAM-dependent methyltransferase
VAPLYDRIGVGYTTTRGEDPRIAAAVHGALGDARSVLNVGAGAGAYEPRDRQVTAVEPSAVMIAQRPRGAPPAVQAAAESLPFDDDSFDAVMAVLSDHHWRDRRRGLREMRRVARGSMVLFNVDPARWNDFWLSSEYLPRSIRLVPEAYRRPGAWAAELRELLGEPRVEPVPIPHDCRDGFFGAFWRRPEAYLDERVRRGISVFAKLDPEEVRVGIARLDEDLRSGAWHERHRDLLSLDELDLGYRVVVAEAS